MFKPEKMGRAVIVGSTGDLPQTIEILHSLGVAHLINYNPEQAGEGLRLGNPLPEASGTSEKLVRLRSAAKALGIEAGAKISAKQVQEGTHALSRFDDQLAELDSQIGALMAEKNELERRLKSIYERLEALRPFVSIGLPLESYFGHKSVSVMAGTVRDVRTISKDIAAITPEHELFVSNDGSGAIALFIDAQYAEETSKVLARNHFSEAKAPRGTGDPENQATLLESESAVIVDKLRVVESELAVMRKKFMAFVLAGEEHLSDEVQKAEAPIHFASTRHAFVIDCWVPRREMKRLHSLLGSGDGLGLHVEELSLTNKDEPPVQLKNPRPVKPYEFLIDLYSTPKYHEIDPTFLLSLVFPLFFGLMVGDLGYGILLMITGLVFMKKFKDSEALYSIGWFILAGGAFAAFFGFLLFGDMFGLSFMPPPGEAHGDGPVYTWSSLLHVNFPIPSRIHKIESAGVTQLLVLSIAIGYAHLAMGLLFGIINERRHNRKHAVGKFGLLLVLTALALVIFSMADGTIYRWLARLKDSPVGPVLWDIVIRPLSEGTVLMGFSVPYSALGLLVGGLMMLIASVGMFGFLEVLEVAGHLISYTRLAAICVAKGAMALAFNIIGLGLVLSGNIAIGILGIVLIVILQLMVFVLGSLSSGIQSLRLHYVEFFMKFYSGGGTKFNPFGRAAKRQLGGAKS